jgi:hypothetical protein
VFFIFSVGWSAAADARNKTETLGFRKKNRNYFSIIFPALENQGVAAVENQRVA